MSFENTDTAFDLFSSGGAERSFDDDNDNDGDGTAVVNEEEEEDHHPRSTLDNESFQETEIKDEEHQGKEEEEDGVALVQSTMENSARQDGGRADLGAASTIFTIKGDNNNNNGEDSGERPHQKQVIMTREEASTWRLMNLWRTPTGTATATTNSDDSTSIEPALTTTQHTQKQTAAAGEYDYDEEQILLASSPRPSVTELLPDDDEQTIKHRTPGRHKKRDEAFVFSPTSRTATSPPPPPPSPSRLFSCIHKNKKYDTNLHKACVLGHSLLTINSIIAKQEWKVHTPDILGRLPLHMVVIHLCNKGDEGMKQGTKRRNTITITKLEEFQRLDKQLQIINLLASIYLPAIHHADTFSETPLDIVQNEIKFMTGRLTKASPSGAGGSRLQMLGLLLCHLRRISVYKYRKDRRVWEGDHSNPSSPSTVGPHGLGDAIDNQEGNADSMAVLASRSRADGINIGSAGGSTVIAAFWKQQPVPHSSQKGSNRLAF